MYKSKLNKPKGNFLYMEAFYTSLSKGTNKLNHNSKTHIHNSSPKLVTYILPFQKPKNKTPGNVGTNFPKMAKTKSQSQAFKPTENAIQTRSKTITTRKKLPINFFQFPNNKPNEKKLESIKTVEVQNRNTWSSK